MSGRIAKSQIPTRAQATLPVDALTDLIRAKNVLKSAGQLRQFWNERGNSTFEGPPLPDPSQGCDYYEKQVGQARDGDERGMAGSKRLVIEVNRTSGQILEIYYTEDHYAKFSFKRIV